METDEHLKDIAKFKPDESTEVKIYKAILEISEKLDEILDELRMLKLK